MFWECLWDWVHLTLGGCVESLLLPNRLQYYENSAHVTCFLVSSKEENGQAECFSTADDDEMFAELEQLSKIN